MRATIQDKEFIIDEWAPYYIEGLSKGEVKIKLELIDSSGSLIDTHFNPSERTIISSASTTVESRCAITNVV